MSKITFEDQAKKIWTRVGKLSDNDGYQFRVFVSGTRQTVVDRFVKYQLSVQDEQSQSGISAKRRPLDKQLLDKSIDKKVKLGAADLTLGISRVQRRRGPHRIHYTIDPPIGADQIFDVKFDNQPQADVLCHVSKGVVTMALYEADAPASEPENERSVIIRIVAGHESELHVAQCHTGSWRVRITAQGLPSVFSLGYDKVVL